MVGAEYDVVYVCAQVYCKDQAECAVQFVGPIIYLTRNIKCKCVHFTVPHQKLKCFLYLC